METIDDTVDVMVEFDIDRNPSTPIFHTDIQDENDEEDINRSVNVTVRACEFCQQIGHNALHCNHPDIDNLHRCAMFIYLTNIRYLKKTLETPVSNDYYYNVDIYDNNPTYSNVNWLKKLSFAEYKILCRLNNIPVNLNDLYSDFINEVISKELLFDLLHRYYVDYSIEQLRNDNTENPRLIQDIYYVHLEQETSSDVRRRFGDSILQYVIETSGRNLLNFTRIKQMIRNEVAYYVGDHYSYMDDIADFDRYYENVVFNPPLYPLRLYDEMTAILESEKVYPTLRLDEDIFNHKTEQEDQECSICYCEMENTKCILSNCGHLNCVDCVVKMLQLQCNDMYNCPMCRTQVKTLTTNCDDTMLVLQKQCDRR